MKPVLSDHQRFKIIGACVGKVKSSRLGLCDIIYNEMHELLIKTDLLLQDFEYGQVLEVEFPEFYECKPPKTYGTTFWWPLEDRQSRFDVLVKLRNIYRAKL